MKQPGDAARTTAVIGPAENFPKIISRLAAMLAAGGFLLVLLSVVISWTPPGKPRWPEAALVLAATWSTLAALTRHMPLQNVLLAASVIAFIGSAAHGLGVLFAVPFGPISFTGAGPKLFQTLPWSVPFLWVIAVLNARGVARLVLRPWRKVRVYGYWLIGLTAALVVLFDFALEPFASQARHYWLWRATKFPVTWHGAPLVNFFGWLVTALLILAFATPALINKQPRSRPAPPDYHPLVVWLLAMALFATGAAVNHLWSACAAATSIGVVSLIFALRGARW